MRKHLINQNKHAQLPSTQTRTHENEWRTHKFNEVHYQCDSYVLKVGKKILSLWTRRLQNYKITIGKIQLNVIESQKLSLIFSIVFKLISLWYFVVIHAKNELMYLYEV